MHSTSLCCLIEPLKLARFNTKTRVVYRVNNLLARDTVGHYPVGN